MYLSLLLSLLVSNRLTIVVVILLAQRGASVMYVDKAKYSPMVTVMATVTMTVIAMTTAIHTLTIV